MIYYVACLLKKDYSKKAFYIKKNVFFLYLLITCSTAHGVDFINHQDETEVIKKIVKKIKHQQALGKNNSLILDEIMQEIAYKRDEKASDTPVLIGIALVACCVGFIAYCSYHLLKDEPVNQPTQTGLTEAEEFVLTTALNPFQPQVRGSLRNALRNGSDENLRTYVYQFMRLAQNQTPQNEQALNNIVGLALARMPREHVLQIQNN